jgi:formylglycine-generating enzyme required for sulfatase activity
MDVDGTMEVPHEKVHYQQVSVGSYPPNPWGLYDMHGLVWQWCQDWYDKNYFKVSPVDDPTGPDPVEEVLNKELGAVIKRKILRGGSWDSFPAECRSAIRMESNPPQGLAQNWGFRVVIVCTPEEIKETARSASEK